MGGIKINFTLEVITFIFTKGEERWGQSRKETFLLVV